MDDPLLIAAVSSAKAAEERAGHSASLGFPASTVRPTPFLAAALDKCTLKSLPNGYGTVVQTGAQESPSLRQPQP